MSLSSRKIEAGIAVFIGATRCDFFALAKRRHIEAAEESRDKSIAGLKKSGQNHDDAVEKVRLSHEMALEQTSAQAASDINNGIGIRLNGALACFEVDDQLETIRHLLLALGQICSILGWKEASAYLSEQNSQLLQRKQRQEAA